MSKKETKLKKETKPQDETKPKDEIKSQEETRFELSKVYLKDTSFESPLAPAVFTHNKINPSIDIQLNVRSTTLDKDAGYYDVVLTVTATAKSDSNDVFLIEVQQGGVFMITGATREDLSVILEVSCPTILLPFAREAVTDLVTKGGFPQLLINTVNFEVIYNQKLAEQSKAEQSAAAN